MGIQDAGSPTQHSSGPTTAGLLTGFINMVAPLSAVQLQRWAPSDTEEMLMVQLFPGKTTCAICDRLIEIADQVVGFPAFLPNSHRWSNFSDAAMHVSCFKGWEEADQFSNLHDEFRRIWQSVPKSISVEEQKRWLEDQLMSYSKSVGS